MTIMLKKKKIHDMSDSELREKLKEFRLELSKELSASEIGTVKNPGKIRALRKTIARMLTERKSKR